MLPALPLATLLFLAACVIDNGVVGKTGAVSAVDTAPPVDTADTDAPVIPRVELCNGADDDGDGLIDEGFGDLDGDGVADCLDDACTLDEAPAGTVAIRDECRGTDEWTPPADPGDFTVEWVMTGPDAMSTPVVAHLTDDGGDGDIDSDDIPDILVVDALSGDLYCYSGDGSGLHWVRPLGVYPMAIAAADVDGDGTPNIVYVGRTGLCVTEADGSPLWCNTDTGNIYTGGPTIVDLKGDGHAEIIAGTTLISGETGATLATDICSSGATFPVAGDLDGDGVMEIVCGASAYSAGGAVLWTHDAYDGAHAALVDVDGDASPEVLVTGWGYGIALFDWDGTPMAHTGINGSYSSACVADLDGDGAPEFAVPSDRQIEVYDADLTLKWTQPTTDNSGASSCSAFDLDADGAYELLYADEQAFYVFDGATGAILLEWSDHTSGTLWEYPAVADVDHDGAAEIIISESYAGNTGVVVLGQATDGWAPAGPTWAQYMFDGGNVSDDGEVLADPPPPWRNGGFTHARPPGYLDPVSGTWSLTRGLPDLGVTFTDACAADCADGPVAVALSATNAGPVAADAQVVLYAVDATGEREVARVDLRLAPGARSEPLTFTLGLDAMGAHGWRATIVRADGGQECDAGDNEAAWAEAVCR